jgi:class I fructose-bisphosphate aldolase
MGENKEGIMEIKEVRLKSLFHTYGKTLILPYDQGLEHGPADFFNADHARDPMHIIDIAKKGRFNAVVMHVGNARRYFNEMYTALPLILKVNGKTNIPEEDEPLSPLTASVDDALELSAAAIGYTLYVGSDRRMRTLSSSLLYVRKRTGMACLWLSGPTRGANA